VYDVVASVQAAVCQYPDADTFNRIISCLSGGRGCEQSRSQVFQHIDTRDKGHLAYRSTSYNVFLPVPCMPKNG